MRYDRGFTLLELLIVLALIGLITAVAAPNFSGTLQSVQTRSAVKKVSAILRYARNQAVASQEIHRVVFDLDGRKVIFESAADSGAEATSVKKIREDYTLPDRVTFQEARNRQGEIETGEFIMEFYPAGNCSGGEVVLSGKPGQLYAIEVDFITGITEVL